RAHSFDDFTAMKRTMQWRVAMGASAAAMLTLASACHKKGGDEGETVQAVVPAQTIVVTPQAFTETMGAIGGVVPRAGHVATLSAPAAGRVGQVYVTTGQTVQPGQT